MLLLWATVTARQNESDTSQIAENSKNPIASPGKSQSQVKNHMVQMTHVIMSPVLSRCVSGAVGAKCRA